MTQIRKGSLPFSCSKIQSHSYHTLTQRKFKKLTLANNYTVSNTGTISIPWTVIFSLAILLLRLSTRQASPAHHIGLNFSEQLQIICYNREVRSD